MAINWEEVRLTLTEKKSEADEEYSVVWQCYDCGNRSDDDTTKNFTTVEYHSDYGTDYDCECLECGSVNTHEDGNGSPNCPEHHTYDWFCHKCDRTMCSECWTWFDCPDGEPEEYLCPKCDPPEDGKVTVPPGQDPEDEEFKP